MEVVAEALLSAYVESLFKMLGSNELLKFAREKKILAELKKWETTLRIINGLLHDAEEKQLTDKGVKILLAELQDLAYDIEDVLDEFATETLKRKVMKDSHTSTDKLQKLIPNKLQKLVSSSCCTFAFKRKMACGIDDITARLADIARQEQSLNLMRIDTGTRPKQQKERPPTTSLVDESHIYGRNEDKEIIIQILLKNERGNNSLSTIAILGMGGIGKTTLAQLVYNDSAIKDYFDIKIWLCVSKNFDVIFLTRIILRNLAPEISDLKDLDLNSLQEKLKEKLSQRKFLLILDDVWEEDYNQWDLLCRPFISAASNSKIVVTTRKINAAPITADVSLIFHVKQLSDDECLLLLACHALGANSFDACPDLKDIGEELVKKCNGLPLAAKVLGGLLRNKPCREQWERVLRNKWWNSSETSTSVHPTLKLSYDDLPSHLKRCFVYCAIFPQDYEFDRDELIRLWMAEGFLHHPQGGKHMEDLGIEYFEDLVSRTFFGPSTSKLSKFVMHDLISDLAQTIAEDICYNCENKIELSVDMSSSKYEKVRHASFFFLTNSQEYEVYSRMKRLRTIWWQRHGSYYYSDKGNKMLEDSINMLSTQSQCLRVLSLADFPITKLSNSIGDLIHLRFINLSSAKIQQLPESVCTLFNLQTLLLCSCHELKKLPDKLRNLVNLRHLVISETPELKKFPSGIGMLTNLHTLSKFIVKEGHETTIAELKNLNNLRGSLSIQGLQNVHDAKSANLKGKHNLEELVLEWDRPGRNDMSVLESLERPHENLKRLTISCYGGTQFPSWMNNVNLLSKLVSLNLKHFGETKDLPPLGQLCSLKELSINDLKAVKRIGVEFYGNDGVAFPSLEKLEIGEMSAWIEWSHGNTGDERFSNLEKLRIYDCPNLNGTLPSELHRLRRLSELEIRSCRNLASFPPMGLPCSLRRILVKDCHALQCFPILYGGESHLEELYIECCHSLKDFEENFRLPTSLRTLKIKRCGNLSALPDGLMMQDDDNNQPQSHLKHLEIRECQGLTSLPTGKFPAALETLEIWGCNLQLESAISENNRALHRIVIRHNEKIKALSPIDCLPHLSCLIISRCLALESLPGMGHFLQTLEVYKCEGLRVLPVRMQSDFRSLRELFIRNCHNVVSLVEDGGLPQNLAKLEIEFCTNLRQPIAEWGLGKLSSLKILRIYGRCPATVDVASFPDDNCYLLPTSLEKLEIRDFVRLEFMSKGLQKLTSLKYLSIIECSELQFLPEEALPLNLETLVVHGRCPATKDVVSYPDNNKLPISLKELDIGGFLSLQHVSMTLQVLTSLENLSIIDCPKLRSLPEEALPFSLNNVFIQSCPLLRAHYLENRGEYPSIVHFSD